MHRKLFVCLLCSTLLLSCKPKITHISPSAIPVGVEAEVVAEGKYLKNAKIQIDGRDVQVVQSERTSLIFVAPSHSEGIAELRVFNNKKNSIFPDGINYYNPAPVVIETIKPMAVPSQGGVPVTLSGKNLENSKVFVDGAEAEVIKISSSSITFLAPEHEPGKALVTLGKGLVDEGEGNISLYYGKPIILTLEYEDIWKALDAALIKKGLTWTSDIIKEKKVAAYAARKKEFIEYARSIGAEVDDKFPELPTVMVYADSKATEDKLTNAPWYKSSVEDGFLELHTAESSRLINHHILPHRYRDAPTNYRGMGTSVVVIDSGVNYKHKAFGECVAAGDNCKVVFAKDFTPLDDGMLDDHGHGTNVAAIIAGNSGYPKDNSVGVAPAARIVSADIMDTAGKIRDSYVISAINWASVNQSNYNIVAINMSLGGGPLVNGGCYNSPHSPAIAEARRSGIVVIVSSGNDGSSTGISNPACVPVSVSVGAVFDGGEITDPDFACPHGPSDEVTCFSNSSVDLKVLAPGAEIIAADIRMSGTSQAAPHVAGAVAALKSYAPSLSPAEIEKRIYYTGIPVKDARNGQTYSRLDLVGLLDGNLNRPRPESREKGSTPFLRTV